LYLWPGSTRVSPSTKKVVGTGKGYLEDILDRPLKALVRAVTPAYKDVPLAALWRETGVWSTKVWMETDALRASARWAALPVERLAPHRPRTERYRPPPQTRLQQKAALSETPTRPVPLTEPHLQREEVPDKEAARELHVEGLKTFPTEVRLAYTDGPSRGTNWGGPKWNDTPGRQY